MEMTKRELLDKGWISIGFDGPLEYFAKFGEHGEIMQIPVFNDQTVVNVQSISRGLIVMLNAFIKEQH